MALSHLEYSMLYINVTNQLVSTGSLQVDTIPVSNRCTGSLQIHTILRFDELCI